MTRYRSSSKPMDQCIALYLASGKYYRWVTLLIVLPLLDWRLRSASTHEIIPSTSYTFFITVLSILLRSGISNTASAQQQNKLPRFTRDAFWKDNLKNCLEFWVTERQLYVSIHCNVFVLIIVEIWHKKTCFNRDNSYKQMRTKVIQWIKNVVLGILSIFQC